MNLPRFPGAPCSSPPLPPRPKAQRFFGYCFVANRDSPSIGVVDLTRFRTRRQIVLTPANGTIYEIEAGLLTIARRVRAGRARRAPGPLARPGRQRKSQVSGEPRGFQPG